jgi:mono/diheme cytochrome c family protein
MASGIAGATLMVAAGVGSWRFAQRASRVYPRQPPPLEVPVSEQTLAHGAHFARTIAGCAECHGEDFGGRVLGDDVVMRLVASNLTPGAGSAVRGYQDGDWWNAILHGAGRSGRSLLVMPSAHLRTFSATDIAAVIAFMRTLPAVDRELGGSRVKPLGAVVLGLAGAPVFSAEGLAGIPLPTAAPAQGATRAYGEYLAGACRGCHGADLRGGLAVQPGAPVSADISPQAMASWQFATFERALRQGVARDGHVLSDVMPWRATRGLTAEEMRALWLGLRSK